MKHLFWVCVCVVGDGLSICLYGSVPLFKHAGSAISKCVGGYICAGHGA